MMKSTRLLGAAGLLFASVAAHAVDDTYVFESVTSSEYIAYANQNLGTGLVLTGVLVNDSASTSLTMVAPYGGILDAPCVKYIDLMLTTPDAYTLSITLRTTTSGGLTTSKVAGCHLTRNP
jgi:hypothetical protein